MGSKSITLLFCAVVGSLTALFGPLAPVIGGGGAILLCIALMVVYAVISSRERRDDITLFAAADEVYLLGYLYTISALAGIGLQLWFGPDLVTTDQKDLLFLAGTKLSTTVVGLIGLLCLKSLATERRDPAESILKIDIPDLSDKIVAAYKELRTQEFAELRPILKETADHLSSIVESIKTFNEESTKISATMTSLAASLAKLKTLSDSIAPIAETFTQINTASGELKEEFENVIQKMKALETSFGDMKVKTDELSVTQKDLATDMAAVSRNVRAMKKVLNDFVAILERKVVQQMDGNRNSEVKG